MARAHHPQLIDTARLERERSGLPAGAAFERLVHACTHGLAEPIGWGLDEADPHTDIISERVDELGYRVGSIVDNVIAGLQRRGDVAATALLRHVTEEHGRLVGICEPFVGYLTPPEVEAALALLEAAPPLPDHPWEERDRLLLIGILRIVREHRVGVAWSVD